jgi:starvation-inducible DNA-binding protein
MSWTVAVTWRHCRQHCAFGKAARKAINEANERGDLDTADLFTEVSRGIDKWLWFVEAHLQAER